MCGIFGFLTAQNQEPEFSLKPSVVNSCVERLFKLSQSRGREAAGLSVFQNGLIKTLKGAACASVFIRSKEYRQFMADVFTGAGVNGYRAVIGHSRLVTNGTMENYNNNQPVERPNCSLVHNGIIVNDAFLWDKFTQLKRHHEVDTEVILSLMDMFYEKSGSLKDTVEDAFAELKGSASIALIMARLKKVILATNTGSLYLLADEKKKLCVFASEKYILEQLQAGFFLKKFLKGTPVTQLRASRACIIDCANFNLSYFCLQGKNTKIDSFFKEPAICPKPVNQKQDFSLTLPNLRRCTKCILPQTMPFIEFDRFGVCNYCNNYKRITLKDPATLKAILEKYRSKTEEADCIVAFSGGRDSSYGLHYIKKVLGMNPIAFTYDWGMVTDLGRRNQSRLCSELGIEHIIISADIKRKRENIKKNILAWLKAPHLGMVPLFMAGDKQFYYHANQLRKRTGVKLMIFCENKLEKTDFKMGFCGIKATKPPNETIHTVYNIFAHSKINLARYYAGQFIRNPAYFNASLADSLSAYFSTYFIRHDYVFLYEYIKWEEDFIVHTLKNEYGWEVAGDTEATWRIGDGTAPFYNYIYYKIAGFSEHDTFLSNQIREGMIARDEALVKSALLNQPRHKSIKEYLEIVGLSYDYVMRKINETPFLLTDF